MAAGRTDAFGHGLGGCGGVLTVWRRPFGHINNTSRRVFPGYTSVRPDTGDTSVNRCIPFRTDVIPNYNTQDSKKQPGEIYFAGKYKMRHGDCGKERMKMKKMTVMILLAWSLVLGGCGGAAVETAAGTETAKEENLESAAVDGSSVTEEKTDGSAAAGQKDAAESGAGGQTDETADAAENTGAVKAAETGAAAAETKEENAKDKADADSKEDEKKEADGDKEKAAAAEQKDTGGKTEEDGEAEQPKLADYEITVYGQPEIMYASDPVNVRKGPATDFERAGGLSRGQEVSVTGQADTGWYEIVYGDVTAYVSGHYLQKEKPAEEPAPQQQAAAEGQPVTEVKNVAGVIMVGDSRFVQMQANIGENSCTWIAENGKGYNWFNETAVARIDGCVGKGSKILINLGVNDPGHVNDYLALVNAKAAEWVGKGAKVYYASVNPVWDNPYTTEEQVEYFNSQMQAGLSADVRWIDSHSYLNSIGYKLVDGLHFNAETYQNIYAYFMSCL